MRAMGLDVGTKTIGVALSDELGLTAQALKTIRRGSMRADLAELVRIAEDYQVEQVIVGLPINMSGSEGPRAQATRVFGTAVERALGRHVLYWDERLSTVEAERLLIEADVRRKKRREVVDQVAASLILQGWLDARGPRGES
jgi:putative Holliday junction resolvase